MSGLTITQIEQKANTIRENIISMLKTAGSGHSAGPLGLSDIFAALYFNILKHDPKNPEWEERDILILSNGHTVPVRYAAMAEAGYFPKEELLTLRKLGSRLQGHPERTRLPGLETTSGPLGSGLSQASGMALGLMLDGQVTKRWVYVVMGDGELDEGNIWEAAMFAGKNKLSNLIGIIDRNNVASVIDACSLARAITNQPSVIIAHTIPGKGVDFMEYDYRWHGMPPNAEQAKLALEKLRTLDGAITHEGAA